MRTRVTAFVIGLVLFGAASVFAETNLFAPENLVSLHYRSVNASGNTENRFGFESRLQMPLNRLTMVDARLFTETIALKMSDASIDETFADIGVGTTVSNRDVYLDLGVSSKSDKPFDTGDETMVDATAAYNVQHTMYSDFYVGLNYSTRRIWLEDMVIPWVRFHIVEQDLEIIAGIPFGIYYRPTETTFMELVYEPVKNIDLTGGYRVSHTLTLQVEAGMSQDKYLVAERASESERLFVERTYAGFRAKKKSRNGMMDISALVGYTMNARVFSGKDYNDDGNAVDIGSAPMFEVKGRIFF